MKKILSFAAFAFMFAATFTLSACGSDDDDDNNTEEVLPDVPQTAEQAKKMLVGQWKVTLKAMLEEYEEEFYYEFKADGKVLYIEKIKSDAPNGKWYSAYKGKNVGYVVYNSFEIHPNESNPSEGYINFPTGENYDYEYSDLTKNSFTFMFLPLARVSPLVEYTLIEKPE